MDLITLFSFIMLAIGIGLLISAIIVIIGFVISIIIAVPEALIHRRQKFTQQ